MGDITADARTTAGQTSRSKRLPPHGSGPFDGDLGEAPTPEPEGEPPTGPDDDPSPRPNPDPAPNHETLCATSFLPEDGESSASALARSDRRYGGLDAVRVFYEEPDPWPQSRAGTPNRPVIVSLKLHPREVNAGAYDDTVRRWFRTAPRDIDIYWSLHHEPEDNVEDGEFDPAEFRTAWHRLSRIADQVERSTASEDSGAPRLHATLILMDWTLDPRSGRNWRDYYPGDDVIDVLGFDVYNHGWQQSPPEYYGAEKQLGTIVDLARRVGKPFGIAELGSVRIPGDPAGIGRALWLRHMTGYLQRHDALWAAYYDIDYDSDSDYRLRDEPSIAAWRDFCAG